MTKTLSITLFGFGIWGEKIASRLIDCGAKVDVIDPDQSREMIAKNIGVASFSPAGGVPPDTNGIIVATPATTHFDLLQQLRGCSVPVFVEKPLTTSERQARQLANLGLHNIFVMHTWMYHPGINALKDIVASDELGELLYLHTQRVNWTSPRQDTDTIWNFLPHDLTVIETILGRIPAPKFAIAETHRGVPRGMLCVLGHQPHVAIEVSNRHFEKGREVRAHFTGGIAVLKDEQTEYIEIVEGDDRCRSDKVRVRRRRFSLDPDPLGCELQIFLAYLNGGPAPKSSLKDGVRIIERVAEIRRLAGLSK